MKLQVLFKTHNGTVTNDDFCRALDEVMPEPASIIYMHTALNFGFPNPELGRRGILESLFEVIASRGWRTLCVPTFTFSFCNNEPFDVELTPSSMGALNEYIRKLPQAVRSSDPMMSVALLGEHRDLVEKLGCESIGAESTFDRLRKKRDVKFLFLGPKLGHCCTYMHYLEWLAGVPYRYNRPFSGIIKDADGERIEHWELFVRYNNVIPNDGSYRLDDRLIKMGYQKRAAVGDSSISLVDREDVSIEYLALLAKDPNFFIVKPFDEENRDDTFVPHKMVAL